MAAAAFTFGGAPPPEVAAYFRDKSLRPAFRYTEVWGQEHAYGFTVAKAVQLDVLTAIRDSLQKAIDAGVPYEAWAKALTPELQRLGWWGVKDAVNPTTGEVAPAQLGSPRRLRTIYDANLRTARAAGQWDRAQRTKAVLPFFQYELGPSEHHRPEHVAREGTIAPVDDPLWDSWYPPNGWGCKCWLRQITRSAAVAAGGPTDLGSGQLAMRTFRRRRDDGSVEQVRVPKGIDPGWATNPGKSRAQTLMQSLATKLEAAGPETAKAAIASLWAGSTPAVIAKLPTRAFAPVAVAPPAVKSALGTSADVAMVGSDTVAAKVSKHGQGSRPVTPADFGRVQAILDGGRQVERSGPAAAYILEMDDGWWLAAVKRAADGRELIVRTLHPIKPRTARSLLRRSGE